MERIIININEPSDPAHSELLKTFKKLFPKVPGREAYNATFFLLVEKQKLTDESYYQTHLVAKAVSDIKEKFRDKKTLRNDAEKGLGYIEKLENIIQGKAGSFLYYDDKAALFASLEGLRAEFQMLANIKGKQGNRPSMQADIIKQLGEKVTEYYGWRESARGIEEMLQQLDIPDMNIPDAENIYQTLRNAFK